MKSKLKRIMALCLIVIIFVLVFLTLYLAATGSRYFMASMFSMFLLPILVYSYMFIYRLLHQDQSEMKGEKPENRQQIENNRKSE